MDKLSKKELMNSYKKRTIIGGIYCIRCSGNNRIWLRSTTDMEGAKNRVKFSLEMKGAPEPAMLREQIEYGWESFSFEVLEELEKEETQTDKEFVSDLNTLLEMWLEKYNRGELE